MQPLPRVVIHCCSLPHSKEDAVLAVTRQFGARLDVVSDDNDGDAIRVSVFMAKERGKCDEGWRVGLTCRR